MGGILGTSNGDNPNDGVDSDIINEHGNDSRNEKNNKRQVEIIAAATPVSVKALNEEPPSKKQRVEQNSQNGGKKNHNDKNNHHLWEPKKTSFKKQKTKHMDPRILKVRKIIQEGCRTNDLASAINAFEGALNEGIRIEAQSYYNLLNLCGGLDRDERKIHVGTPKQPQEQNTKSPSTTDGKNDDGRGKDSSVASATAIIDSKQRQEYVFAIKAQMQSKEVNLSLNETAYSAIVKILSKNKEFQTAEEILEEAEKVQQCKPKLRLYASLLHAYCDEERLSDALKCWKRLRRRAVALQEERVAKNSNSTGGGRTTSFASDGMDVTEREYLSLLQCAIRSSIGKGSDLVIEDVLTRLAEDIPVPAKDTVSAIAEWFEIQSRSEKNNETPLATRGTELPASSSPRTIIQGLLDEIRALDALSEPSPRMGPIIIDSGTWTISRACSIDSSTGVLLDGCLQGHMLQPVPLSDRSFEVMTTMNDSIVQIGNIKGNAHSKFQGGRKGKKRLNFSPEERRIEWERFAAFLEQQVRKPKDGTVPARLEPYEVVIDGANIGYYKQNFASAPKHVDYEQIDWVVRHFTEKLGKKVLLVMHNRHFSRHMLPHKYRGLCDAWSNEGILYKTPAGMNDDWFWMHAALKYKTLVVTNDEMRDHHFQMLAPKFFLRWKERHQVHFAFGICEIENNGSDSSRSHNSHHINHDRYRNSGRRPRKVLLTYPNAYSRRIQRVADGLVVPLTKRGDENRFLDGCHVASHDEPEKELYLCARPSSSSETTADAQKE